MGMSAWHRSDLQGYAWSQAFAKACEIAETEEALEYGKHSRNEEFEVPGNYVGEHRLEQVTQLGQLKDLVYYAAHLRGFVRADKPFEVLCADPGLDALRKRLRGLSGQMEMED